jgi:signal peptidase II
MTQMNSGFSSSHAWRAWLALAAALVLLDQVLKAWVSHAMPFGASYTVTSFFNLVHARNPGAAFSFLADAGGWQRWFFLIIALAAVAFLTWLIRRGVSSRAETIAYVAILAGALGNAVDRGLDTSWTFLTSIGAAGIGPRSTPRMRASRSA